MSTLHIILFAVLSGIVCILSIIQIIRSEYSLTNSIVCFVASFLLLLLGSRLILGLQDQVLEQMDQRIETLKEYNKLLEAYIESPRAIDVYRGNTKVHIVIREKDGIITSDTTIVWWDEVELSSDSDKYINTAVTWPIEIKK